MYLSEYLVLPHYVVFVAIQRTSDLCSIVGIHCPKALVTLNVATETSDVKLL